MNSIRPVFLVFNDRIEPRHAFGNLCFDEIFRVPRTPGLSGGDWRIFGLFEGEGRFCGEAARDSVFASGFVEASSVVSWKFMTSPFGAVGAGRVVFGQNLSC